MNRVQSLFPAEALRLAALGMLAENPRGYGELAAEISEFASHVAGPSLDLLGTSIELLRYEGLIEAIGGGIAEEAALLDLTATGRAALSQLLRASLAAPASQINRLFVALKLRFLPLLPERERRRQLGLIAAWYRTEHERVVALRGRHAESAPEFLVWLDHEAAQIRAHIDWLDEAARDDEVAEAPVARA
ncbi:MAG: hypothetical protein JWL84_4296 [Rhodospirillales bacterium]|jgi:DNA-binding PadR family transcriptional regulator|nr:hypothetical protein [Rhodospirillales bacterium]